MGMYTQIRGFLCIGSIQPNENIELLKLQFEKCKNSITSSDEYSRIETCKQSTIFFEGSNSSCWIFIGIGFKNYDKSFDKWLAHLLSYFDNAEGRIESQYEQSFVHEEGSEGKIEIITIYKGKIVKIAYEPPYGKGYLISDATCVKGS